MQLWIGWQNRIYIFYTIFVVLMTVYIVVKKVKLSFDKSNLIPALVFVIAFGIYRQPSVLIFSILSLTSLIIILLNEEDRVCCWRFIYRGFSLLMIPSIILFLLYITVGIPSLGTIAFSDSADLPQRYVLRYNYIFYNTTVLYDMGRFNGPFNEPGHLGMMGAFMLFADGMNLKKKESWPILLSVVLSLSLAGYVLFLFGLLFTLYAKGKLKVSTIIGIGLFIFAGYLFAINYNNGDNIINEEIYSRFERDEDKGIVGNNRITGDMEYYFETMWDNRDLILHGVDCQTMEFLHSTGSSGTGIQAWLIEFGVLGVILFYIVFALYQKNKKMAFLFLSFVILMFLQRSYPYWYAWVICYVYGLTLRKTSLKNIL